MKRLSDAVGAGGCGVEEGFAFPGRERGSEAINGSDPVKIGRGDAADGPIRTEHQARGSEGFERGFHIRKNLLISPGRVVGLGDNAGKFTEHIGPAGCFGQISRPGLEFSATDGRLRDVIEDEDLVRVAIDKTDGSGKLVVDDEDVVGEVRGVELRDAGIEVGAIHVRVWLGLQDVANAFETWIGGKAREEIGDGGIDERDPADDGGDPGMCAGMVE